MLASALLLLGAASALRVNETTGPVVFPGAVPVFYQGLNGSKCYRCGRHNTATTPPPRPA